MNRGSRLPRAIAALAVTGALALSACTGSSGGGGGNSNAYSFTSFTKLGQLIPVDQRKKAQDIGGTLVAGGSTSLTKSAGKVRLINFFASWCPPCQVETPQLAKLAQLDSSVSFLGVDIRDRMPDIKSFLSQNGVRYPVLFDQQVRVPLQLGDIPANPPVTVLVDKAGRVAAVYDGAVTVADLRPALSQLAKQS